MSNTSFHYGATPEAARGVLEQIEQQFRLSNADLMRITSQFLKDFELGLSEYNHPMAMMYVPCYLPCYNYSHVPLSSPTFVTGVPDGTETG